MAIQYRRGEYADFDPTKLKPGEAALVLSGDPASLDGKSVYFCFNAGSVKRMATYDDMLNNISNATSEIQQQFTQELENTLEEAEAQISNIQDAIQEAENAASGANTAANTANQAASSANYALEAINEAIDGTLFNDSTISGQTGYTSQKI